MTSKIGKVVIRTMDPADIDAILALDHKITGLKRALTYDTNKILGGQFDLSFVSEVNGDIIGFILASIGYIHEGDNEACIIQTIGVDSNYWRKGIASKLVQALLNTASSKGIKKIRTMVDQDDKQLCGFFKHFGFERGRLIGYSKSI